MQWSSHHVTAAQAFANIAFSKYPHWIHYRTNHEIYLGGKIVTNWRTYCSDNQTDTRIANRKERRLTALFWWGVFAQATYLIRTDPA